MNNTKHLTDRVGFVLCIALLGVLTGCTTYVEQPRQRAEYYPEQPRPREVYVPPQPAYVPPPAVVVDVSVGVGIRAESDFYEPLTPYGRWQVVGSHGRCWIPARVEANWRPYSNGHWERTDAGWYWVSDEPWAWATYHYGRWDFTPQIGWYWVPQTQWAPAWVSWHQGGGYVGWAPLHPSARVSVSGSVDVNVALIPPRAFVFVEQRQFLEPVRPTTVVVNNTTVINKTVNITKINVVNNTVINEGPRTEVVEQASGRKVQVVPVRELRRKQEAEVVARQRIASPGREKNEQKLQAPVRSTVESSEPNAAPAPIREQRSVEKAVVAPNQPVAPAASSQVREIDDQNRAAKSAQEEEKRVRNEKAPTTEEQKRVTKSAQDDQNRATKLAQEEEKRLRNEKTRATEEQKRVTQPSQDDQNRAAKLTQENEKRLRNEKAPATEEQKRVTKSAQDGEKRAREEQARATKNEKKAVRSVAEGKPGDNLPTAIEEPTDQKAAKQAPKHADKQDKRAEEMKKGAQRQSELRAKDEQAAREEAKKKAAKKDRKKKVEEPQTPPETPAVSPPSSPN